MQRVPLLFSITSESEVKYVTNYSNNELVTKSSTVPDCLVNSFTDHAGGVTAL